MLHCRYNILQLMKQPFLNHLLDNNGIQWWLLTLKESNFKNIIKFTLMPSFCCAQLLSRAQLFVTPCAVACQHGIAYNAGDLGLDPWVWKMSWRREWLPTPIFLPGKFHGQRLQSIKSQRVGHDWTTKTLGNILRWVKRSKGCSNLWREKRWLIYTPFKKGNLLSLAGLPVNEPLLNLNDPFILS